MPLIDYTTSKQGYFFTFCFFFVLIGLLLFPYLKTEYLTFRHADKLNTNQLCQEAVKHLNDIDNRYNKILHYQENNSSLQILCLYNSSLENRILKLEKQKSSWIIIYSDLVNKDRKIYYPFYI
jgi:hypothetical protein